MTISMYQASAPRLAKMMRNLDAILAKAQTHATAKKFCSRLGCFPTCCRW